MSCPRIPAPRGPFPPLAITVLLALLAGGRAQADEAPSSLTLDEALQRLDAQSLTLAQARGRAEEARGVLRQALAPLLPTLSASGSYVRNSDAATLSLGTILDKIEQGLSSKLQTPVQLPRDGIPGPTVIQPLEAFNGQAALRVPVFAANAYSEYMAAQASSDATRAMLAATRLQLRGALLQAAWWSGAAEEIAAASERALGIAEEHERSAERAVRAGTAAPLAHLQAQTDVVRRENDVARTRAERERAWLALGVLLGEARPVRLQLPPVPTAEGGTVARLSEEALAARPELRALESSVLAAQRQVDAALWRLAPQLSVSASAFASNVAFVTGKTTGWRASVDLTWPLYDGGLRYGKRGQAEGQLAQARAGLEAQRVAVTQDVLDALRDLDVAKERTRLAQRQKELALEVAASAKRSFAAGLASSLDVLDANDRLFQADVAEAEARARHGMAVVALTRARGAL